MRIVRMGLTVIISSLIFIFSSINLAIAVDPDLDFYKGKVINYIVATKPGGGYDAYARLIGRYMQKYLPGSTVIVKNLPGAGHIIGANETYFAKPNGLTIGTFNTALFYSQLIGQSGVRFDLLKYSWIGKAITEKRVLIVDRRCPINNYKDLMESKTPIKLGSNGVGTANHQEVLLAAEALNFPLKLIPGYQGREGEMAMLRGEIDGQLGSYTSLRPYIVAEGCRMLMQFGATKHPEILSVPLATDLKTSPKGKKLLNLIAVMAELGRLTAAPPGIPAGRLQVLRNAYKKALTDPSLIKDAVGSGMEVDPGFGEEVDKMVRDAMSQPAENKILLKKIIKID